MILSETTDSLQFVLSGAITTKQLQCVINWTDLQNGLQKKGRNIILSNNTTDIVLATLSANKTIRIIDSISIFNSDTANATATIKLDANGTEYILFKTTLATGEKIEYQNGQGFKVFANSGAVKQSINQGNNTIGSALTAVVLGSDVVNNNAVANTIQNVTGLSFEVTAGNKYYFKFIIPYTAAAATTGSRWSISGPAAPTLLSYISEYTLTSTTSTRNAQVQAYDLPAASNASSVITNNFAIIEGFIIPSANGTVIARFASEVLSSAITAKAGAVVYYQQTQ